MTRIKKKGLDYFPIDTRFMLDRRVRQVLRTEGDAAGYVLLSLLAHVYGEEGYYLQLDDRFYEALIDECFRLDIAALKRVVNEAVAVGLFDRRLFEEYGVLTSAEIQEQFLFSTKRRGAVRMDERFVLLSAEEIDAIIPPQRAPKKKASVPKTVKSVPENPKNSEKRTSGTHSTAQHSIAQHRKENSSLLRSSECAPTCARVAAGGEEGGDFAFGKTGRSMSTESRRHVRFP